MSQAFFSQKRQNYSLLVLKKKKERLNILNSWSFKIQIFSKITIMKTLWFGVQQEVCVSIKANWLVKQILNFIVEQLCNNN